MPLVIVGPGNDEYSIPENPYGSVLDVNLLPDVNEAQNKVSVLPGEVKRPGPAYRKTVDAQSGNLEQDVWDQMMKAPVTLSAEHWLAASPGMRTADVTEQENGVEPEAQGWDPEPLPPVEEDVSQVEGGISIDKLPAVHFYVTTMHQGLIPAGSTIIPDPVVQYLESLPMGEKPKPIIAVRTLSEMLRAVYLLVLEEGKWNILSFYNNTIVDLSDTSEALEDYSGGFELIVRLEAGEGPHVSTGKASSDLAEGTRVGFSELEDLIPDQGELAVILAQDADGNLVIESYTKPPEKKKTFSPGSLRDFYLCASDETWKNPEVLNQIN
ncbi:hypothetical protein IW261DRAFT_1569718 [Armillaria novae-zelandiae]|uniref:Uncharacterized protein n=1 Tax=Armillaria novae-zelandiae TaxID=153914 RepID=A0AA39NXR4_9AGAR|nr:hypothetical protein IW261DRAFT_1569718 [Armillaria novae-zelandiae]